MNLPPSCLAYLDTLPAACSPAPIAGDAVARKLQGIHDQRDTECAEELAGFPWLREAMWFLQYQSHQPGGLALWWRKVLRRHAGQIAPAWVRQALGNAVTLELAKALWRAVPRDARAEFGLGPTACVALRDAAAGWAADPKDESVCREIVGKVTPEAVWKICASRAASQLPVALARACQQPGECFPFEGIGCSAADGSFLENLCDAPVRHALGITDPGLTGGWYLPEPLALLRAALAEQVAEAKATIAPTSVAALLFGELGFALQERRPVMIHGSARYGKTESLRAWIEARPGMARLVTVPPNQRERDMLAAMADALGISHTPTTTTLQLRSLVSYVVRWDASSWYSTRPTTFSRRPPGTPCLNGSTGCGTWSWTTPSAAAPSSPRNSPTQITGTILWHGRATPLSNGTAAWAPH